MTEMAMHAFTGVRKISPHLCPAKISVGTELAEFSNSRACIEISLMKEDSINKTVSGATISDKAGHVDPRLVFEYLTEKEVWEEIIKVKHAVTMPSGPKNKLANIAEKIVLESKFPISMYKLWKELEEDPRAFGISRKEPYHKYLARFTWHIRHRAKHPSSNIKNPVAMVRQNGIMKFFRDDR